MNAQTPCSVDSANTASEAGWTRLWPLDAIPRLGARVYHARAGDIAVFRTADDQVFALRDRCPHKGGPLSQGIVFGHAVACPLHSWTIRLDSGEAQAPDVGCAARHDTKLEDGVIWLRTPAVEDAQAHG